MFRVNVDDSPEILVRSRSKQLRFATDATGMNPLEAFYATLAGCAAVYVKKSCAELAISPAGIEITCRPAAGPSGPLSLARFETTLAFPPTFDAEQIESIRTAVESCAVKQIVRTGNAVEFCVTVKPG